MNADTSTARIVHKDNFNEQHFFDIAHSRLPPLKDSWVRVQSRMITISSMNLSYCLMGRALAWFEEVPLPPSLPSPFNDESEYAIAPGWGFGEVVESKNPGLPKGSAIYGHMPTSAFPFDLLLHQSPDIKSHWIDRSEQRKRLMAAYNRFVLTPEAFQPDHELETALTLTLDIPFEVGYVLNRFVFPSYGDKQIHPFPVQKLPWSTEDSDLTDAVLISLAAGGKCSRAFIQQLATNRAPGSGPSAVVEVTSSLSSGLDMGHYRFEHRVVGYDEALSSSLTKWISSKKPKRIMVMDFGGRDNIGEQLEDALRARIPRAKVNVIAVGREAQFKPTAARVASKMSGTRMNTSGIRVEAIKQLGEAEYFEQSEKAFHEMLQAERKRAKGTRQEDQILGVRIDVRYGLKGSRGFEQAWTDLCSGRLAGDRGLIFHV